MPRLQERDFYLGAALSLFFRYNKDSKPSMIEKVDKDSQLYKMSTDTSHEFYLFIKFTRGKRANSFQYSSWAFPFTEKDKLRLQKCIDENINFFIFLVCGENDRIKGGEIAVITSEEYVNINHKSSVTIHLSGDKPHVFNVHIAKARSQTFPIKRNRITNKLTDLLNVTV